jgi:hypothetical protein
MDHEHTDVGRKSSGDLTSFMLSDKYKKLNKQIIMESQTSVLVLMTLPEPFDYDTDEDA